MAASHRNQGGPTVKSARSSAALGKLRIVGGNLRGSKIEVPDHPGLRPTADRVRETLFNWLVPVIAGARCLDLFAGTGAIGIEAWSRGAAAVDFVERDPRLVAALRDNLLRLTKTAEGVRCADALALLTEPPAAAYDIVFLDPPFGAGLWEDAAKSLAANGWLADRAMVYIESPLDQVPQVPGDWTLHREGHAGSVRFALYRVATGAAIR